MQEFRCRFLYHLIKLIRKYRIRKIDVKGKTRLPKRAIRRELAFFEGAEYSDARLEETLSRVRASYQTRGYYRAQVTADEARVAQAEAKLQEAELQLRYTRIVTPVSGVVTGIHIDLREKVNLPSPQPKSKSI